MIFWKGTCRYKAMRILMHTYMSGAALNSPCCHGAGMLDVQQIFGRAGRPQYEDSGQGIIITQHAQLSHYLGMLTHQLPIESQFINNLVDNLNAEIVLGEPQTFANSLPLLYCGIHEM